IAQEALNNSLRHGAASSVTLQLALAPAQAELRISDDGVGFDPAQLVSGHFGLVGIKERARLLGGAADIRSSPGAGTAITIRVPLEGA
ncbi:MAG TPA: ATP-binding protein, partial [Herpetosiphonaceae bacterium]